jgi:hypothetical protein
MLGFKIPLCLLFFPTNRASLLLMILGGPPKNNINISF